jgi:hypothetical protein
MMVPVADGDAAAVPRPCWIAIDATACNENDLSILKIMSTIKNFPNTASFRE